MVEHTGPRGRPSIFEVEPSFEGVVDIGGLTRFVRSAAVFIAELHLFYPSGRIVFLARDMEYHYDIARLLFANWAGPLHRFHLANVSRDSLTCPLLAGYCKQEIFSGADSVVLVDSGFNGNVIRVIRGAFPGQVIRGHLLSSDTPDFPSSHASLASLGISPSEVPSRRKCIIEEAVEQAPHFDAKAMAYERRGSRLVPVGRGTGWDAGRREKAVRFMAGIRALGDRVAGDCWDECLARFGPLVEMAKVKASNPRTVVLSLDAGLLLRTESSSGDDRTGCPGSGRLLVNAPFGFEDFLGEVGERIEAGQLRVRIIPGQCPAEVALTLLGSARFGGRTLQEHGIDVVRSGPGVPEDWVEIRYPAAGAGTGADGAVRKNHQKGLNAAIAEADALHRQSSHSEDQVERALWDVLGLPEGPGFIRDLLEEYPRRRLGIRLRGEVMGVVWGLISRRSSGGSTPTSPCG